MDCKDHDCKGDGQEAEGSPICSRCGHIFVTVPDDLPPPFMPIAQFKESDVVQEDDETDQEPPQYDASAWEKPKDFPPLPPDRQLKQSSSRSSLPHFSNDTPQDEALIVDEQESTYEHDDDSEIDLSSDPLWMTIVAQEVPISQQVTDHNEQKGEVFTADSIPEELKDLIDPELAREAMLKEASEKGCWGTGAAKRMVFNEEKSGLVPAYRIALDTFIEQRCIRPAWAPHQEDSPIDELDRQRIPDPWDIPVPSSADFENRVIRLPIPHTDQVKICFYCQGYGSNTCSRCCGRGFNPCKTCRGRGRHPTNVSISAGGSASPRKSPSNDSSSKNPRSSGMAKTIWRRCFTCHGSGKRRCDLCTGNGTISCKECQGSRYLRHFSQVVVARINHCLHQSIRRTDLPKHIIETHAQGIRVLESDCVKVGPISDCFADHEEDIKQVSEKIYQESASYYASSRLLRQRWQVTRVPIYEAYVSYGSDNFKFFCYGIDYQVHAPEYPMQCGAGCCNCFPCCRRSECVLL